LCDPILFFNKIDHLSSALEFEEPKTMCVVLIQLISVYSGNRLPRELVVQLCDEADNPSPEDNVRIQLTREASALKVY